MPRADGRTIKTIIPFSKIIPYIMPHRYDATNFLTFDIPQERMRAYLARRKESGTILGFMPLLIAAYVRTTARFPEVNRFVVSKKIYARNGIQISFVTLKNEWAGVGEQDETVSKLSFTGFETVDEVNEMLKEIIESDRKTESSNAMDKLLRAIFRTPLIPSAIVSLLKLADKLGLLPRSIIHASPFHASMFFSNMASIRSHPPYHHLYDFGTISVFLAFGYSPVKKNQLQLKAAADERICSGSSFVRAMHYFVKLLLHPEQMETPPEEVREDLR